MRDVIIGQVTVTVYQTEFGPRCQLSFLSPGGNGSYNCYHSPEEASEELLKRVQEIIRQHDRYSKYDLD